MKKLFGKTKPQTGDTLILYATKSGNAKKVAALTRDYYRKQGMQARLSNVSGFEPRKLEQVRYLLLVVSTDGEGDPPPSARKFFRTLCSGGMKTLPGLQYSVCALGDSSYEQFCEAGRKIDHRLRELEARPFYPRTDCDVDFSTPAINWIKASWEHINGRPGNEKLNGRHLHQENPAPAIQATLVEKRLLSPPGGGCPCYHLELAVQEENFSYKPGDSIAVKPRNPHWLVRELLALLQIDPETKVMGDKPMGELLIRELELTRLSSRVLRNHALKTGNPELRNLLNSPERLTAYLSRADIPDMFRDFGPRSLPAETLAGMLQPMNSRQYSIASAPVPSNRRPAHLYPGTTQTATEINATIPAKKNAPNIALTVKPLRYSFGGHPHEGAASVYLCDTLEIGQHLHVRHVETPGFHLPEDKGQAIIMIGNGTGIAPFRAFMQERGRQGIKGGTWLIFGEKNPGHLYYREDFHAFLEKVILERMDTAWSRETGRKIHVQDLIQRQQNKLVEWINRGAFIYVCGSLSMGREVKTLIDRILKNNPYSTIPSVETLEDRHRYREDVY